MTKRRGRALLALAAACVLAVCAAAGEGLWPEEASPGEQRMRAYVEEVNRLLAARGQRPINSVFECYPAFASVGITAQDGAETAEDVEISLTASGGSLQQLVLWTCESASFPDLAACLIAAAAGGEVRPEDVIDNPKAYMSRISSDGDDSFSDEVIPEQGDTVRMYYAYEPDKYGDRKDWLQMTLIFPREGEHAGVTVTPVPTQVPEGGTSNDDGDPDWVGYYSTDEADHFSIFVTPTPEPDSAAAEEEWRNR